MDLKATLQRYEEMNRQCESMTGLLKQLEEKLFQLHSELKDEILVEEDKKDENQTPTTPC